MLAGLLPLCAPSLPFPRWNCMGWGLLSPAVWAVWAVWAAASAWASLVGGGLREGRPWKVAKMLSEIGEFTTSLNITHKWVFSIATVPVSCDTGRNKWCLSGRLRCTLMPVHLVASLRLPTGPLTSGGPETGCHAPCSPGEVTGP